MKKVYAIPTTHCNLSCDHCYIKNSPEKYIKDVFLQQINSFDGTVVLFGGEPTLYRDRFRDAINTMRINSVSTNLLNVDPEILSLLKIVGSIATSWNPNRFSDNEYQRWLDNMNQLVDWDLKSSIMITITNDLLDFHPSEFMKIIEQWNPDAIRYIIFEHYVGDTDKNYFHRADQWLSDIYIQWNSPIQNKIIKNLDRWFHNCDNIYTLFPDGNIVLGCPHQAPIYVPKECLSCNRVEVCRPCKLQKYCSYPKQLSELIQREEELN